MRRFLRNIVISHSVCNSHFPKGWVICLQLISGISCGINHAMMIFWGVILGMVST